MSITKIGIDLAKNSFSLHGVDSHGKTALRKTMSRSKHQQTCPRIST